MRIPLIYMKPLYKNEIEFLQTLRTAKKVQEYLDSLPFNHEESGETCRSVLEVIRHREAHCLEGAMLAAHAFSLQGRPPLILSLKVLKEDYDHVVALYKENGYWGAVSKTNHVVLGFRDPVYKSIRELALSYFHEYFLVSNGKKTMRGYSRPINMNRFGKSWIDSPDNLFTIAEAISDALHSSIIPKGNEQFLRDATDFERTSASVSYDGN